MIQEQDHRQGMNEMQKITNEAGTDKRPAQEQEECCCSRHKERTEEEVRCLVNRLNRIEGQIRGMVEKVVYCPDILTQSAADTAAMNGFNRELLASHIRSCVADDIRKGDEETVDELVKLLQKLMK